MVGQIFQLILSAVLGLLTGIIGSYIGFHWWPKLRRECIWKSLRIVASPASPIGAGSPISLSCRVVNGSPFTMGKAMVYILFDGSVEVLAPPPGRDSYMKVPGLWPAEDLQLCWAVQESGNNPMRTDIYSGEQQPLVLGFVSKDYIEILSENCQKPTRAFLPRSAYAGHLRIVCSDCRAKEFAFKIDPIAAKPLSIQ